jgi:hypothetical protein
MAEELRAQADINPIRRMREQVRSETTEKDIEQGQGHHANGQDMQGCKAFMNKHLIDNDLREQRREKAKQLKKE